MEDQDEREEGEIVDLNDDDIYENIISSDDEVDEDDLRQRIEELEAKNSELEKIASISKTYDYGLGSSNYIDLVDDGDDDESYYRQPSKYDYSSYTTSSRKRSRSKRRKACRHETKKTKRYKPYKTERRKKTQPNRTRVSSDSSSDDEFELDRDKLQAALKRNTSSIRSSTLKRKLIGVSKTVEDFIKAKEDVGDEDISTSIEIMHLLNKINVEEIAPKIKASVLEEENETCLNEQELRIIALRSAILKKAEVRKRKKKIIETQPYSPTDDVVIENVIASKVGANAKPRDEFDNMEISPAVSPSNQESLQPIDMELESDEDSQIIQTTNIQQEIMPSILLSEPVEILNVASKDLQHTLTVPVPDEMSLSTTNVPEETNHNKFSSDSAQQRKQQEEEEEQALRASLLANLKTSKRKAPSNESQSIPSAAEDTVPSERPIIDASVEMEQLRKQVISSMQKRKNLHRDLLPNPFARKFSVQVPKPIEMTMPQITSNLKEALKRIKERDKQNGEVEVALNDQSAKVDSDPVYRIVNVVSESGKEIQVDGNKSKRIKSDISELKNIAIKLNGVNVNKTTTRSDPILPTKKPFEPNNKVNDVLKNVTCNNSSVETKTKDATVPLVVSNKIETAPLEKNDPAIKALKAVAQKKVIAEPHASLNQKENQQLRKIGVSPKRNSEERLAPVKKPKINNVKVSRVITTPVEKPVKQIIIQLNNSDTESDDLGLGQQNVENNFNYKSYSGVASPASYSFSPLSPASATDNKPSVTISPTNDSFQRKLDEYLKTARTKVEQTKQETKTIKKSPSLVSHLPPSSQLEYRKLINRMALLEKQKLLKMNNSKVVATKPKPSSNGVQINSGNISITIANEPKPSGNISVTITNDLFNHQPKSNEPIVQLNGNDANSRKENDSELVVTLRNVDSEIDKQSKNLTRTSTTTVFTDSGIKSNSQRLPEVCILTEKKALTKESEKSTHCIQNFSTLSDDEKTELLQRSETEYMSHSELYLLDLNNMSLLVNKARQEKEKQFQIESEIEQLELKVQQLNKQLVEQKATVSKLYPEISSSHKNIMKKRSKSLQLNKKCYFIGNKIVGTDYKINGDPKADIAQKVKSLSSETKLLRNMTKTVTSEATTPVLPSISTEETKQTEFVNHTTAAAASVAIPMSPEKPPPDDAQQSSINCTPDNIPYSMPYSMMKYKSPLEHMQNIGITNPDSIVCPFQLLGQCEDKECTYQHLS